MNIADLRTMPVDLPGYVNAKDLNSQIIWISNLWVNPLGFNRTEAEGYMNIIPKKIFKETNKNKRSLDEG